MFNPLTVTSPYIINDTYLCFLCKCASPNSYLQYTEKRNNLKSFIIKLLNMFAFDKSFNRTFKISFWHRMLNYFVALC